MSMLPRMATTSPIFQPRSICGSAARWKNDGARSRTRTGFGAAVTHHVAAELASRRLHPAVGLARRWAASHAGTFAQHFALGQLVEALLEDPQALAHLLDAHQVAAQAVAAEDP